MKTLKQHQRRYCISLICWQVYSATGSWHVLSFVHLLLKSSFKGDNSMAQFWRKLRKFMKRITVTVASVQRLLNISFDLYCLGVALSGYILFDQLCCCRFKKNSIEIGENWDKKFVIIAFETDSQ